MHQPKKPSSSPAPAWQDEGLEFELTDIEEARRILDSESVSPSEVDWKRLRRVSLPTDRALTGRAIDWLLDLPSTVRPQTVSRQFPRVINALVEVWHQPEHRHAAFESLLSDGRKGRKGFPVVVHDELAALRNWVQAV